MTRQAQLALYSITAAALTGLMFNFLFLWKAPGLSVPLFYIWIVSVVQLGKYYRDGKFAIGKPFYLYIVLFLVSLVPLFTQNTHLDVYAVLTIMVGLTYTFIIDLWGMSLKRFNYLEMLTLTLFQQIAQIGFFFKPLIDLQHVRFGDMKNNGSARLLYKIFLGLLVAVPLVLLMLVLFSTADEAFSKIFAVNLQFDLFAPERGVELVVWVIVSCLTLGYISVLNYYRLNTDNWELKRRVIDPVISLVVAVALNLVFICFVIVQFVYLFAGKENIAKLGITYAEYARQGFWELLVTAAISLLVVYVLRKFGYFRDAGNNVLLQFTLVLQVVLTLIVLYSAYFRLNIYEQAYAFTETRLYVYAFMLFLAITFVYLGMAVVAGRLLQVFSLFTFSLICLIIFGLGVLNPDAFIAQVNIERYVSGQSPSTGLDTKYLINQLSSDAYLQLVDVDIYKNDTNLLCLIANAWSKETKYRSSFQAFNLYRASNVSKAESVLHQYLNDKGEMSEGCYRYIKISPTIVD